MFVFRGFVCLFLGFCVFVEVFVCFKGVVCWFLEVLCVCAGFCGSCLSSTKRPGSIFAEF